MTKSWELLLLRGKRVDEEDEAREGERERERERWLRGRDPAGGSMAKQNIVGISAHSLANLRYRVMRNLRCDGEKQVKCRGLPKPSIDL